MVHDTCLETRNTPKASESSHRSELFLIDRLAAQVEFVQGEGYRVEPGSRSLLLPLKLLGR